MTDPSTVCFCKTLWNQKVARGDKKEYLQLSMHHKVYLGVPAVSIYSQFVKEKKKEPDKDSDFYVLQAFRCYCDINIFVLIK
jgi:hypothetical protein